MGRALSVLVVQINHQDGHKAQILRGGPLTGRCSESEVENHLQVLPPTSGLPPGGRDPFCPQILIQPHLPGYYSPGGAGVSLWDAGETTGVCHGDDTFANASLGRGRAHLVKLEQGFPPPPPVHHCGRRMCRSVCSEKGQQFSEKIWSLGFGCV